jgi:hypothetical protein
LHCVKEDGQIHITAGLLWYIRHALKSKTAFNETPEDLFHNYHLDLQERMQNPIAFHAEMMGDIMYYDQALQQPDAK